MLPDFRVEQEVILSALRAGAVDGDRVRDLMRRNPDWSLLRETARNHGVLPLLYARLREVGRDLVPPGEMARMRELYSANSRRNLRMGAELLKVLKFLDAHGIVAIPVKGPVLAESAYGDIALRQFVDLDLLVRGEDILRVKELLVGKGFLPTHAFTGRQEEAHLARDNEFTFEAEGGKGQLDVHWRFAAAYLAAPLDAGAAFERRVEGRLLGRPVPALAHEDALLYLCLHGTFHLFETLGLVCDVARLLESRDDWDWRALMERAASAGLRRTLLLGVTLARDLLHAPVPPGIGDAADRDRAVAALRARVRERLFRGWGGGGGFVETALFQLRSKELLADKVRYCLIRSLIPTVEDWKRTRLPDSLYFLYYLLRPLRLAGVIPRLPPSPSTKVT